MLRTYNNTGIRQRLNDHYLNATETCQSVHKDVREYFKNTSTHEFVQSLSKRRGIPIILNGQGNQALVEKGVGRNGATWVHPHVAVNLAQWAGPEFAVQVSEWVFDWLETKQNPIHAAPTTPEPSNLTCYPMLESYLAISNNSMESPWSPLRVSSTTK
jgi:KilA-N domain